MRGEVASATSPTSSTVPADSRPPGGESPDGAAFLRVLDLVVGGRRHWQTRPVHALEQRHRLEQWPQRPAVVGMVGRDPQGSAGLEPRSEELEEDAVEEPALLLLFLRPGVGEVDVKRADGAWSERRLDEDAAVAPHHPCVGQAGARNPFAAEPVVGERAFDAEVVAFGERPGRGDQEARLPAADLDLERRAPREDGDRIERTPEPELLVGCPRPPARADRCATLIQQESRLSCPRSSSSTRVRRVWSRRARRSCRRPWISASRSATSAAATGPARPAGSRLSWAARTSLPSTRRSSLTTWATAAASDVRRRCTGTARCGRS